jgi:hypothetical protein
MLSLGLCETCYQLRLRGPHRGDDLVYNLQPARREPYEEPPPVLGVRDAAHQSRSFEAINAVGHRPGREQTGAVEGRRSALERGTGTAQSAQDIEQFPGQAIGLEDGVDPTAYEAGKALEATQDD